MEFLVLFSIEHSNIRTLEEKFHISARPFIILSIYELEGSWTIFLAYSNETHFPMKEFALSNDLHIKDLSRLPRRQSLGKRRL